MATGSYGILNYWSGNTESGKKEKFSLSSSTHEELLDNLSETKKSTLSAEYILKNSTENYEEDLVCKKWENGIEGEMDKSECKKIIQEKWNNETWNQPKVWFRADKDNIEEALWKYFANDLTDKKVLLENKWEVQSLECTKNSVGKKIEVSCYYKEGEQHDPRWIVSSPQGEELEG